MQDENSYWKNRVSGGIGTMVQFIENYNNRSSEEGSFITASTMHPTGRRSEDGFMVYEYVIFHKDHPNKDKHPSKQPASAPKATLANPLKNEDLSEMGVKPEILELE